MAAALPPAVPAHTMMVLFPFAALLRAGAAPDRPPPLPHAGSSLQLQPNAPGHAQELNGTGLVPCRNRNLCSVLLDVPAVCISAGGGSGGGSQCPIGFFFHGHTGHNTMFPFSGAGQGVHQHGFIGVYPQGAIYAGESGWNDGSMDGNKCQWDDYSCDEDPNDGTFTTGIIDALRKMGAGGRSRRRDCYFADARSLSTR